jgi:hypothetical protein
MHFKDYSRKEKILDSNAFPSDVQDKIAMTEKYLRLAGGHAYAAGGTTNAASEMDVVAEIRLQDAAQPTQGVGGGTFDTQTIGQLRDEITRSVRAEIKAEQYEREKAEFEREKKEFEKEKQGAIGTLIHYLAPVAQQLLSRGAMPRVAGMDVEEPVHAAPIVVDEPQDAPGDDQEITGTQAAEESPFTDEEADELFTLMARFKKVEPEYLTIINKVVTMAESGDKNYQIARMTLL